jgi:peptidoglycan/LPS O-acetylase OafA/YrhL
VYIFHATWAYSSIVEYGYGLHGENHHLLQLPILRLVHAGHAVVALFFLVGGYVNAVKPLQLIRNQRYAELTPAVSSSLLRRAFRLYLPAMAATLTTALLTYAGLLEPSRHNIDTLQGVFYYPDLHPGRFTTLWATLVDWRKQMFLLLDIWNQPFWTHYDPHLWTVPLEFRASLVLSVSLTAVAYCRAGPRLCIMALLTAFTVGCDRWEVAIFFVGAILAELDLIRSERAKAANPVVALGIKDDDYDIAEKMGTLRRRRAGKRLMAGLGIVMLSLISLYLLSYPPKDAKETPGFALIAKWFVPPWTTDSKRYVHGTGAVLFLIAISSSKTLQGPFLTTASQYLGTISYAFYIVHGPVLHSVGYVVGPAILALTGTETDSSCALGVVLAGVVNFVVSLIVADVFYRFVDVNSVRAGVAFQRLCSISGY